MDQPLIVEAPPPVAKPGVVDPPPPPALQVPRPRGRSTQSRPITLRDLNVTEGTSTASNGNGTVLMRPQATASRTAPAAQPSGSDPRCHFCIMPKQRECVQCGNFCCKNHIDVETRCCPECTKKNAAAGVGDFTMKVGTPKPKDDPNNTSQPLDTLDLERPSAQLVAEQQRLLDSILKEKEELRTMKMQAADDLRKTSEQSMQLLRQREAQLLAAVEERRENARKEAAEQLQKAIEASKHESARYQQTLGLTSAREAQLSAAADQVAHRNGFQPPSAIENALSALPAFPEHDLPAVPAFHPFSPGPLQVKPATADAITGLYPFGSGQTRGQVGGGGGGGGNGPDTDGGDGSETQSTTAGSGGNGPSGPSGPVPPTRTGALILLISGDRLDK